MLTQLSSPTKDLKEGGEPDRKNKSVQNLIAPCLT
jgi:hypothetical protein